MKKRKEWEVVMLPFFLFLFLGKRKNWQQGKQKEESRFLSNRLSWKVKGLQDG